MENYNEIMDTENMEVAMDICETAGRSGLSTGAKVGIVVGAAAVITAAAVGIKKLIKKHRANKETELLQEPVAYKFNNPENIVDAAE